MRFGTHRHTRTYDARRRVRTRGYALAQQLTQLERVDGRVIARGPALGDSSRREFDELSELESVHGLVAETIYFEWHEVMHRVLIGRVCGRCSINHWVAFGCHFLDVGDHSSLCVVCLRVAAYAVRAVATFIVRG